MGTFRLPISKAGYITIPKYLRERYLTPEVEEATVQAIGPELQITIESDRKDLMLRLELKEWVQGKPRKRSMNEGRVHVERWRESLRTVQARLPGAGREYAKARDQEVEINR